MHLKDQMKQHFESMCLKYIFIVMYFQVVESQQVMFRDVPQGLFASGYHDVIN